MHKCWYCGKEATVTPTRKAENNRGNKLNVSNCRWFCEECAEKYQRQHQENRQEYIRLKADLMVERAIRSLEHQPIDLYEYKDAIEAVTGYVQDNPQKIDSADEVIAAIILVNEEIPIKLQASVGKYHVDFMLPSIKTILEVDGDRHADRIFYDNKRDKEIRSVLGDDWEIVHIKTEYVQLNAKKLYDAVIQIRTQKQLLRAKYDDDLPYMYHEKGERKPKKRYGDELLLD